MKNRDNFFAAASVATGTLPALPEGEEIYGILPEVPIPHNIPWWVYIILFVFLLIGTLIYILLKRKNKADEVKPAIVVKPKEHPRKVALRRLNELLNSKAYKEGLYKDVCVEIQQILKAYSYDLYNIGMGASDTNDEFLKSLDEYCIKKDIENSIKLIIKRCDRFLYMGDSISRVDVKEDLSSLEKIIKSDWQE